MVIDSCACGLGIISGIAPVTGNRNVLYLADTEFNPLGLKSNAELVNIIDSWFDIVINDTMRPDIIIIGCNTASIAFRKNQHLFDRKKQFKIIDLIDAFERMLASDDSFVRGKKVGLLATKYTINSGFYQSCINKYAPDQLLSIIATKSERAVANSFFLDSDARADIIKELAPVATEQVETVVLACTCLRRVRDYLIEEALKKLHFLDPVESIFKIITDGLESVGLQKKQLSDVLYLNTGDSSWGRKSEKLATHILGSITFETVQIQRSVRVKTTR